MKYLLFIFICLALLSCSQPQKGNTTHIATNVTQQDIKNDTLSNYPFLKDMYSDSYFPKFLVDKGKAILVDLCVQIEKEQPKNLEDLYKLTHAATEKFNGLEAEFLKHNSEIETAARESIAADFEFIAKTYGYKADVEELIAPRNW